MVDTKEKERGTGKREMQGVSKMGERLGEKKQSDWMKGRG